MFLNIQGQGPVKRSEFLVAIPFIMRKMNAHRLLNNMEINLKYDRKTPHEGYCLMDEPKCFEIGINPIKCPTREAVISTLAHELVHLKQFARRELKHAGQGFRYGGMLWNTSFPDDLLTPWEIEAYGKERGLTWSYFHYANSQ